MLKKVAGKLLGNKSKGVSLVTEPVVRQSEKDVSVKVTAKNLTTLDHTAVVVLITLGLLLSQGIRIELGSLKDPE